MPQAGNAQYQCSTGIFAWDQSLNVLYFGGGDAISFQMGFQFTSLAKKASLDAHFWVVLVNLKAFPNRQFSGLELLELLAGMKMPNS